MELFEVEWPSLASRAWFRLQKWKIVSRRAPRLTRGTVNRLCFKNNPSLIF